MAISEKSSSREKLVAFILFHKYTGNQQSKGLILLEALSYIIHPFVCVWSIFTDYNETLINVRIFHIGNYTNIWYNKTLLAWYFKKVKSSNLTGDLQIGTPHFNRFWWVKQKHLPGGNVLCHTKEMKFLQIYISFRFQILCHRPICFHHLKFYRR